MVGFAIKLKNASLMNGYPSPHASIARPLRILEVGGYEFFSLVAPDQTDLLWACDKPRNRVQSALGPIKYLSALAKLRRGEYDLVVIHASQYAPWHPRTVVTILSNWHIRWPLGLFARFAWRFMHICHNVPIVAVDLDDPCLIGRHNFFLLKCSKAFYKRELPSDHWLVFCRSGYPTYPGRRWRTKKRYIEMVNRLRPISYGHVLMDSEIGLIENGSVPTEKTVDVFFSGAIAGNSTARSAGVVELETLKREGYIIDIPNERLTRPEFLRRMSKAWLAWSPAGLGWDCSRHYEAALSTTVPLINFPNILRDVPLMDGKHCVFYPPEPGGLTEAVKRSLANKSRLHEMALAAHAHVKNHHSIRARAERVAVAVLGRRLDGTPAESK